MCAIAPLEQFLVLFFRKAACVSSLATDVRVSKKAERHEVHAERPGANDKAPGPWSRG